ncbi:hypothetical protein [Chryseobacterium aureum]|uniref:hypothetical protein n=1 Tax=Chryseobacterium aureum TaxID=2497456 RepID=UPI000F886B98|nr:hypothetical protein [Chryseobacterium aureum]
MEFKGTKGKWTKQQNREGDIQISSSGFRNLATVNFYPEGFREKYINGKLSGSPAPDSSGYRRECIYNAKLIAKAPEMLEMLQKINNIENEEFCKESFNVEDLKRKLSRLIKEATEI